MVLSEGTRLGRYRIESLLGRGGMGAVYRAMEIDSGRSVAVKTILGVRPEVSGRLRRELHVLSGLRHPGIVRVLGSGEDGGQPWFAMEYIQGPTLLGFLNDEAPSTTVPASGSPLSGLDGTSSTMAGALAPPPTSPPSPRELSPERLARALGLVRRLCQSLAYLHGEGLVHRDLKPANVLIRRTEAPVEALPPVGIDTSTAIEPVLVDFGLVAHVGGEVGPDEGWARERLLVDSRAMGTIRFMSPEQLRGELVDARSDLYSLGCILYVVLTGRAPFEGASSGIVFGHLRETPVPPSALVAGVSKDLDRLVLRLLEKSPRDRFGHADDVAAVLADCGADSSGWGDVPASRPYLYRADLVGRARHVEELRRMLLDSRDGSGVVVLLGGDSGIGKTRLAVALTREAQALGDTVMVSECPPVPIADVLGRTEARPLCGVLDILRAIADRCQLGGEAVRERILGDRGDLLAPYEPLLAPRGPGSVAAPVDVPRGEAVKRLMSALLDTVLAAAGGPALLVIDDVHWADDLTLRFVEACAAAVVERRVPLMVVATYRIDEAPLELGILQSHPAVRTMRLEGLDGPAIAEMVGDMLAMRPPPYRFSSFLAHMAEGNPFFVAEYLRAAIESEIVWRDEVGRWRVIQGGSGTEKYEQLPLPQSIRAVVRRRLDALSPDAAAVVDLLAVIGRAASQQLVWGLLDLDEPARLGCLDRLLQRHFIEEDEDGLLRFAHSTLREVAYARLAPADRRALHTRVAEALASGTHAQGDAADMGLVADHWAEAGRPTEAVAAYERAATEALVRSSYEEALRCARAGRDLGGGEALIRLEARTLLRLCDYEAAQRTAELAVDAPDATPEGVASARLMIANARGVLGAYEEQLSIAAEVAAHAPSDGTRLAAEHGMGSALIRLGRFHEAYASLRASRRELDRVAVVLDPASRARIGLDLDSALASVCLHLGSYAEAHAICEDLLQRQKDAEDRHGMAGTYVMLGVVQYEEGHFDQALEAYMEALAIKRQVHDRYGVAACLNNIANVHSARGFLTAARSMHERALAVRRQIGDMHGQATSLTNICALDREVGDFGSAMESARTVLSIGHEIGDRETIARGLLDVGAAEAAIGRFADAVESLSRAVAIQREIGNDPELLLGVTALGDLLFIVDDLAGAAQCLTEAGELAGRMHAPFAQVGAYVGLARVLAEQGRHVEAEERFAEAESLTAETGLEFLRPFMLGRRARCRVERDPERARQDAQAMLGDSSSGTVDLWQGVALGILARCEAVAGGRESAVRCLSEAAARLEKASVEARLDFEEDRIACAARLDGEAAAESIRRQAHAWATTVGARRSARRLAAT